MAIVTRVAGNRTATATKRAMAAMMRFGGAGGGDDPPFCAPHNNDSQTQPRQQQQQQLALLDISINSRHVVRGVVSNRVDNNEDD